MAKEKTFSVNQATLISLGIILIERGLDAINNSNVLAGTVLVFIGAIFNFVSFFLEKEWKNNHAGK